MATASYRIRLARTGEVPRLRDIEDEAGTLFAGLGLVDEILDGVHAPRAGRGGAGVLERSGGLGGPQLTAFFTSARSFFSSAAVSFVSA
jgi:hypothetical protein